MRLHFKPMPWLTVITVLGFAFLLKLGFWQKERLAWKLDILNRVEAAAKAPPFTSLAEVTDALAAGEPVDFRRINAAVTTTERFKYWLYIRHEGAFGFRSFDRVTDGQTKVYSASVISIPDPNNFLSVIKLEQFQPTNIQTLGYVRLAPKPPTGIGKWVKNDPNPEANLWFAFNQDDLWEDDDTDMRFWIDARDPQLTELPPLRPEIRNNHWQYMWTWWSFAGLLLIFYILLHRRAGRLKLS